MFAARLIPTNVLLYTCWAPLPILVEVENGAQASHRISHRGAILQLMQAQMYSAIFIASRLGTFMSGERKKKTCARKPYGNMDRIFATACRHCEAPRESTSTLMLDTRTSFEHASKILNGSSVRECWFPQVPVLLTPCILCTGSL